ncbi:YqaJ viral recombinase family protein [Vibrio aestuarianus subsp. cardii]|uniref:YqaJ viral recombinase family protein n=1 Tax=Vibrio aestuarianus TaxID=28171 RepID=UPI001559D89E|nr:YqaJ viral recombinase family protein [Vibrio aestuarianus]NGZ68934.1 YqaJ viral recombinase family protein [Vibrio aestuarianus subsp. cardii]
MPIIDIVQRSEKWFAWRKQGITASMIPVIMGLSPYQTPYELWAELVGHKQPDDLSNNYHVQRGVEQEPEARNVVENQYGIVYMPVCVEADHNQLFKASLDGLQAIAKGIREVLEIKCPCEKIYNELVTLQAKAPTFKMYAAQVQWQLNCAGSPQGRLFFYLRGKRPIAVTIKRDDAFIKQAEERALWFWNLVQTKTPPPMMEGRDNVVYDTPLSQVDPTWLSRVEQLKEKRAYLDELQKKLDAVKADVKQLEGYFTEQIPSDVKTFDKDGIRATRVDRKGSVNYQAILDDFAQEVNLEVPKSIFDKHTKEGSSYYLVTVTEDDGKPKILSESDVQVEQPQQVQQPEKSESMQVMTLKAPQEFIPTKPQPRVEATSIETQPEPKPIAMPAPPQRFFEKSVENRFF